MADKKKEKKSSPSKRANEILSKIVAGNNSRSMKQIKHWRNALKAAENPENPNRLQYYNLCDDLDLDGDVTAEFQKRMMAVVGASFSIVNEADQKKDVDKTKLFEKPWFYYFLELYMETILWGHTLIQIGDLDDNLEISKITPILRRHVKPEKGIFIEKQSDQNGTDYRNNEQIYNWLIEVGKNNDLGLFKKLAPYILYIKFSVSAWSEYNELFVMPLRVGKTNSNNTATVDKMEKSLISAARAAYMIIDKSEEIEFVNAANGDGSSFEKLINKCEAKILRIISGAVIGTESKGGSRSKEEVGEKTEGKITKSDLQKLEVYINFTLFPKLIKLGYPLEGFKFKFDKSRTTKELWEITKGLLTHYDVEEQFIVDTFGIPVTKKIVTPAQGKDKDLNADPDHDFFA